MNKKYRGVGMQYDYLAEIYDKRMVNRDEVAYNSWFRNMETLVERNNFSPKSVLDLCCGTGLSTFPWARKGLEVYGIDMSKRMLEQARRTNKKEDLKVKFVQGKAQELYLDKKFDLVTSVFDSLNHILNKAELQECFDRVYKTLNKPGVFMFDMNTEFKHRWLNGRTHLFEGDGFYVVSKPTYDKKRKLANFREIYLIKRGNVYEHLEENIKETNHTPKELKKMLSRAGFKSIKAYDAFTLEKTWKETNRVMFEAWKV